MSSDSSDLKEPPTESVEVSGQTALNNDRELWRERAGDYYADSIHVTEHGGIGINCGGSVFVRSLRAWHGLAASVNAIERLHAGASQLERDAIAIKDESLHNFHQMIATAGSLRAAANWLDGVAVG